MNKINKKIISVILSTLIIISMIATNVFAAISVPDPMENFYANDFANVMTTDTTEYIINLNEQLYNATGAQIVITTVNFTDGVDIGDYAYTMFNKWKIGDAKKNNGILLLLAIGDDNYYYTIGEGLEKSLSTGDLGDIVYNNLEQDFANTQYDAGIKKTFDALIDRMNKIYGTNIKYDSAYSNQYNISNNPSKNTNVQQPQTEYVNESYSSGPNAVVSILFFFFIIMLVVITSSRRRRGYYGGGYYPPARRRWFWGFNPYRRPYYPHHHHDHHSTPHNGGMMGGGRNTPNNSGHSNTGGGGSTRGAGGSRNTFGGGGFGSGGSFGGGSFGGGRSGGFGGHSNSGGGGGSRGAGGGRR